MQVCNWISDKKVKRMGFASSFCLVLSLVIISTVTLNAQSPSSPFGPTALQIPTHDVTLTGTVKQLVSGEATDAPRGLQLLIDGVQGQFTASLGTKLSQEVQQSLSQGAPVQISGYLQTINGKLFLMARTLTIDGKQIIVRNQNGVLVNSSKRPRASEDNSALYRSAK